MTIDEPGSMGQIGSSRSFAFALRESLAGAIIVVCHDGVIASTPKAQKLLGLPATTALGTLPAPLPDLARETLVSRSGFGARCVKLQAGGRGLELEVSAVPLAGEGKAGALLLLSELAANLPLEAHMQQVNRLANVGTLAASMAHEIRNALVAGKTYIDLLLEKKHEPELVEVVRRELSRIDAIASRVLRFAAPGKSARLSPVHLHEVLEHALRLVQPEVDAKGIQLERALEASPDVVNGDEYELQQAVINLLLNGLEALTSGGSLSVRTARRIGNGDQPKTANPANLALHGLCAKPTIYLAIQDNGTGMSPQQLERLFEPFFTTKPNGTGLGLAITRGIVRAHQGDILVRSQSGQGTTFELFFPALETVPT